MKSHDAAQSAVFSKRAVTASISLTTRRSSDDQFVELFNEQHPRLVRYIGRLANDFELGADIAQSAFVRLYQRGSVPDAPGAWLVTVAMNLLRNAKSAEQRRHRLLTVERAERVHADSAPSPDAAVQSEEAKQRVRRVIRELPEREQRMLLLRAEGYSYREIALALDVHEASVGTLIARAQREFRQRYEEGSHAP